MSTEKPTIWTRYRIDPRERHAELQAQGRTQQCPPPQVAHITIQTPLGDLVLSNPEHYAILHNAIQAAELDQAPPPLLPIYLQAELRHHFSLFPLANDIVQTIAETIDDSGYSKLSLDDLARRIDQPVDRVKAIRAALVIIEVLDAYTGEDFAYFRLGHGITDPTRTNLRPMVQ